MAQQYIQDYLGIKGTNIKKQYHSSFVLNPFQDRRVLLRVLAVCLDPPLIFHLSWQQQHFAVRYTS